VCTQSGSGSALGLVRASATAMIPMALERVSGETCRLYHNCSREQSRINGSARPGSRQRLNPSESQLGLRTLARFGKREHAGATTCSLTQKCHSVRSQIRHQLLPPRTTRLVAVWSIGYWCGNRASWALVQKGGRSQYTQPLTLSIPEITMHRSKPGASKVSARSPVLEFRLSFPCHTQFPED